MSSQPTTTIFSTTTITSTKTLTRTILTLSSLTSKSTPGTISVPDNSRHESTFSLYPYHPSLPLAIIFAILYLLTTIHHGYLALHLPTRPENVKKHRYTVPLVVASLLSTLGYVLRSVSIQRSNITNVPLYATSTALILVTPILICATLYILLTRLITRCLPSNTISTPTTPRTAAAARHSSPSLNSQKFLFLTPTLLSVLLITSDTLSFLTQILGAAIASTNHWTGPSLNRGTHILLAGLTLQLTTFLLYLLVFHTFCLRVRNSPTHGFNPCIMKVVVAAWVASAFVLLRTVFRLVEFAVGPAGFAYRREWCLYVFEALPVWVALVVLAWWHPVKWVQERTLAAAQHTTTAGPRARGSAETVEIVLRKPVGQGTGHVRKRSRVGFAL